MVISGVLVPIVMFTMIPVTAIGIPLARAYARRLERGERSGCSLIIEISCRAWLYPGR